MLDIEGTELSTADKDVLQRNSVGGLILFSRNYETPTQLKDLINSVREIREDILIAVDQEGGRVQRFREGFLKLPALKLIGDACHADEAEGKEQARLCAWAMAAEILYYGIDLSFAPVLDLHTEQSRVIGDRSFGSDPGFVIAVATAYIDGMNDAGMKATGKHFPGHGTVAADSHEELPCDERSAEEILQNDYRVFAELANRLHGIMPAHVKYPALDANPAGYSSFWIREKIRRELQFDGVVFSDDLSMNAAHSAGNAVNRASLAINAGCDMILVCNDRESALGVAEWIEREGIPESERIGRMRAEPATEIANLYSSSKWGEAKTIVNLLSTD